MSENKELFGEFDTFVFDLLTEAETRGIFLLPAHSEFIDLVNFLVDRLYYSKYFVTNDCVAVSLDNYDKMLKAQKFILDIVPMIDSYINDDKVVF